LTPRSAAESGRANRHTERLSRSLAGVCLNGPLGIGKRYAARVFHNWSKDARGQQAPRLVHLWKDRLTAAVVQPAFWALGKSGGLTPLSPRRGLWEREEGQSRARRNPMRLLRLSGRMN